MISKKILESGGEMGALTGSHDWSKTSLGPLDDWPHSLCTAVSIILSSKFPMFLWWGPDLIQFYNDAYRPSLGNNGKHPVALGQRGEECWPEIWPIIKPLIDQVLNGNGATWSEDQLIPIYRNGQLEDVYWTFGYSPVSDEFGNITGVLVVCSETTEKIRTLQEIKKSNEQYQFVIDGTELGTWDYNPGQDTIICSDRTVELFGFSQGDKIDLLLALNAIIEKDRERVHQAIRAALAPGSDGIYKEEYSLINYFDKKKRTIKVIGKAIFNEDRIAIRMSGTAQDITNEHYAREALAESEKNVRNIFSNAPVAISFFRGPEYVVEIANNLMLEIWGKTSEQVLKKPVLSGIPEFKEQGLETLLKNVYETGIPFIGREYPVMLFRKGKIETVFVNFVYEAYKDTDGSIIGIVVVATEITEQVVMRKRIEEIVDKRTQSLKEANQHLQRSNSELEQFAYVASHDLQEPLRKIKTFAGMLNSSLSSPGVKEKGFLEKILSSSERMSVLIDDVLSFSRLSEKINNTVKIDLNEILIKVKEDLELELEKRNVVISCDKLPVIMGMPIQMNQLFFNLLSNSLKFSKSDEQLRINIFVKEPDAKSKLSSLNDNVPYVEIIFQDNGIGFEQKFSEKIFNIFQRLNGRTYPGSGIGLALCRRIVSNHGGELFALSEENKGAEFHVILPLQHVPDSVLA